MPVTLRIATPNDAEMIHEIYEYYINHTVVTFSEVNPPIAKQRELMAELLQTYPFLVAHDKGHMLGFANAEPLRLASGYRFSVELTIYLHPQAPKHTGIGSMLYKQLLTLLSDQGFKLAYGVLSGTNAQSYALHEAFGFEEVARFKHCGYKHGQWLDAVWMQKKLSTFDEHPAAPIPFSEYRKHIALL